MLGRTVFAATVVVVPVVARAAVVGGALDVEVDPWLDEDEQAVAAATTVPTIRSIILRPPTAVEHNTVTLACEEPVQLWLV